MENLSSDAQTAGHEVASSVEQEIDIVEDWKKRIALPEMLLSLGENLERRELQDTPERMRKAWREMLEGYTIDPEETLGQTWPAEGADIIDCGKVHFTSICEHHLLPFIGHCRIIYSVRENGEVAGLSKLARIVDCFSRRLQIQERMCRQIAEAIMDHLKPEGVVVEAIAQHLCCVGRGVRREHMTMRTIKRMGDKGNELIPLLGD